jgi:hypothetical protein
VRTAEDLYQHGLDALVARRLRSAERWLSRAQTCADSSDLSARIKTSLAFLRYETGEPEAAFRLIGEALAQPGVSADVRGVIECQRAMLLLRRGQLLDALSAFDDGIAMLGDPVELGKAYHNRGGVHLARGDAVLAAADFRASRDAWERVDRPSEAAMAAHNLGYTAYLRGDLIEALRDMDVGRARLEAMSPVMAATVNQDRAEVLMAAGLVEEGRAALREAARAYGARRMHQRRGEAQLALALTQLPAEPSAALVAARSARSSFARAGVDAWITRAEAAALAAEVELGRKGPSLVERGETLATDLDAQGLTWRAVNLRLRAVRVLVRRGDHERARSRLAALRSLNRAPLATRLLARDVRAELAVAQGRRSHALTHLRGGLADLHAWQSSFGSLDLQTGVAGRGLQLGMRGLELAVESGKPSVLFEWSERARMLASRVQPVRAPEDESIVADLAELREMAQARDGVRRTSREREAQLRQRVRERAWQHRGSGEVVDPVSLDELRAGVGDDGALVAYVVTAERLVALVVTPATTTWVDLGSRVQLDDLIGGLLPDLDVAASDLSDGMAAFVRGELAERLGRLAALLVAPVLDAVGDRCVVLTPSGVLAGVPWTLLPGFAGRPVTVAQSATSWLARRKPPLRMSSAGFVAGPRVARAEDEVTAAAKEWDGARVLMGDAASAAAVSDLANSVDVLHVAAHGRHSSENPMFSGLQLADGPWFGYDIDQLRSVPDIVLLSACEVGRSTVRWGEELIGMTTAWLHAGTRCVIASAAAINDHAAYDVLVAVHEQLSAGVDPAAALAAAVPAASADTAPVPLVCFG